MAITEEQYEFWRRHVQQWQESGLNAHAYSARHGIDRISLGRWQRRLAERPAHDSPITLVPATRVPDTGPLILRNGPWQLELPAGTSAEWLADLLERLS